MHRLRHCAGDDNLENIARILKRDVKIPRFTKMRRNKNPQERGKLTLPLNNEHYCLAA